MTFLSVTGCGDWPHFDYAPAPLEHLVEVEGAEEVQNLHTLTGDLEVTGRIDGSRFIPSEEYPAPFELPGWYYGDLDWFQFSVKNVRETTFTLTRSETAPPEADLDLYFFTASSEGVLSLADYADTRGPGPETIVAGTLSPGNAYVLMVGGYLGDAVDYSLLLQFSP